MNCIKCKKPLKIEITADSTIAYCKNKTCPRYGLYTAVGEEDKPTK